MIRKPNSSSKKKRSSRSHQKRTRAVKSQQTEISPLNRDQLDDMTKSILRNRELQIALMSVSRDDVENIVQHDPKLVDQVMKNLQDLRENVEKENGGELRFSEANSLSSSDINSVVLITIVTSLIANTISSVISVPIETWMEERVAEPMEENIERKKKQEKKKKKKKQKDGKKKIDINPFDDK